MRAILLAFALTLLAPFPALAFTFTAIQGEQLDTADWAGRPILVVNTASLCGYTPQYADLQALHERYGERGLVVLAVPSDDFRQELDSNDAVEEYCRVALSVDVPLTQITRVTGPDAHPFYQWMAAQHGFQPNWNFNKVLLDGDGAVLGTWRASTRPTSHRITRLIEGALPN